MRTLWALLAGVTALGADFQAGVARVKITPETPAWLVGFAARTKPASDIGLDLWAKALALEDGRGGRVVLVAADLLGFTREVSEEVAARAGRRHGLRRDQIVFLASHTHSGPAVQPRMRVTVAEGSDFERQASAYTDRLIGQLEYLVTGALAKKEPVNLAYGWGSAGFAINRRKEHLAGIRAGEDFPAPVDPRVPVLRVTAADGKVLAVVFGYACHNTVLTGDTYEVTGDYAGYAQKAIEERVPGATALFMTLCAGDQRAAPRGTRALAEQHGITLADAVAAAALRGTTGPLRTAFEETRLPFTAHTREAYGAEARSADVFAARRGRAMLAALDAGKPITSTPYPVQAVRFGEVTILALGGEVVVDYALRLRKEYGDRLVVAAYANDLPGYIPSLRVQREGGYEAGDSLMYFLQPGWFTEEVEPRVLSGAARVLSSVGVAPLLR